MTHYEFRCPFGLAFDEVNLMCNWPWLVPACGGGAAPAGAIRAGKAFGGNAAARPNGLPVRGPPKATLPGRRPGGNGGRGGLGGSGGLGGVNGGSGGNGNRLPGSFISSNPARQPFRTSTRPLTARPTLDRAPKVGPGSFDIGKYFE